MISPRIEALRVLNLQVRENQSELPKEAFLRTGFAFIAVLAQAAGIYDGSSDFHDMVSADDEGNLIFQ